MFLEIKKESGFFLKKLTEYFRLNTVIIPTLTFLHLQEDIIPLLSLRPIYKKNQ